MNNFSLLGVIFIVLSMVGLPAVAQTPDTLTPAEETVCDPLMADGVTKGLYGLCVAFCEAQDHAALTDPIEESELEALATSAPSGKILASYNKRKQDTDPEMPCILVDEPCPCWTPEELNAIDGYFDDGGGSMPNFDCLLEPQQFDVTQMREFSPYSVVQTVNLPQTGQQWCLYQNGQASPLIFRLLTIQDGNLTLDELKTCKQQVVTQIAATNCPVGP